MQVPAIVFPAPGEVEVRDMEVADPGPGEVRVKTAYSGVSQGTERWVLLGRYDNYGKDPAAAYPCSPGYQAAGVVDALGPEVLGLEVGDAVIAPGTRFVDPGHKYRGPCAASHAAYLVASVESVTKLPPGVDLAAAAHYHVASVSRSGVRLARIAANEVVLVLGLGMVGQMTAQAARRVGAFVVATERVPLRLAKGAEYSADVVVDVTKEEIEPVLKAVSPRGADVVIDTTGVSTVLAECLRLIRREGRVVLQGYYPDPITIDFHPAHIQRPTIVVPCGWDDDSNAQIVNDLRTKRLVIEPLITHRVPFERAKEAYDMVLAHPEESLGMVFDWTGA